MLTRHTFYALGASCLLLPAGYALGNNQPVAPTHASANALKAARNNTHLLAEPNVIYFDAIENGEIVGGGVIPVDQANPMHSAITKSASAAPYNSSTIVNSGPTGNRIDLVLVGDGYTAGELSNYQNHANNLVNSFFNEGVLNAYRHFFNVHRVDVISNQSGVDNDPQGTDRDTALDMTYYCNNIARLLCVNVGKANQAAQNAPAVDQILALANSTTYGGAGYSASNLGTVAGNNGSALEVAIHEFGHSFADLADEYSYGGPETYTGPELSAVNVSIYQKSQMQTQQTKWHNWFDVAGVDTFEGGNYSVYGVYRPTNNSKMRSLGQPFGAINDEQFIIKIYQSVSPIDSATPQGNVNKGTVLQVNTVNPLSHTLTIEWWVDGQLSQTNTNTFDTNQLGAGNHNVAVRVVDNTDKVRNESARQNWMTAERLWTVMDSSGTPVADLGINLNTTTFLGWATPFQFWKNSDQGLISYSAQISNNGPDAAQAITARFTVPSAASFSHHESDQASCYIDGGYVSCEASQLNAGSNLEIKLHYTTQSSEPIEFDGYVNSDTADPDSRNNTASGSFGGSLGILMMAAITGLALRLRLGQRFG